MLSAAAGAVNVPALVRAAPLVGELSSQQSNDQTEQRGAAVAGLDLVQSLADQDAGRVIDADGLLEAEHRLESDAGLMDCAELRDAVEGLDQRWGRVAHTSSVEGSCADLTAALDPSAQERPTPRWTYERPFEATA